MSEQTDLNNVLELIKAGQKSEARQLLLSVLKTHPRSEEGWLYMAACAESKAEFESSVLQVLRINPFNNQAYRLAEQNKIRLPKEIKQARKKSRKAARQVSRGERSGGGRLRRILLLLVLVLAVVAAAAFLLREEETTQDTSAESTAEATEEASGESTAEATEGATQEVTEAASAEPTLRPTQRPTRPVTVTPEEETTVEPTTTEEVAVVPTTETTKEPTLTPTPTPTRTPSPTRTPTPEPTLTPTPTIIPTLRLVYNDKVAYIKNISEVNQDISQLRFVQELPDGKRVEFEAIEWQQGTFRGIGSPYAIQPESCFQVGVDAGPAATQASDCLRLHGWVTRNLQSQFWLINNGNVRSFVVLLGEQVIIECEIAAGKCEFALPETP
jgi:hypothetical protein